jgi:hypothetical protein
MTKAKNESAARFLQERVNAVRGELSLLEELAADFDGHPPTGTKTAIRSLKRDLLVLEKQLAEAI